MTPLQQDILRTILYFDIFKHPLDATEIYRFLPSDSTSPALVGQACRTQPLASFLSSDDTYFSVAGKRGHEGFVQARQEKERRARRYWRIARFMAHIIRLFPFVRCVCVSGELSKGVAASSGDIDFFIITSRNRLWISRTLLILFKKLVLMNRKKFFCLNHFISEDYLPARKKTIYDAMEIATLVPLSDYDLYLRYWKTNAWVRRLLPNATAHPGNLAGEIRGGMFQRILEVPFRGTLGDRLDLWLMKLWSGIWRKRYPEYTEEKRNELFHCSRGLSTSYVGNFLPKILMQYRQRIEAFRNHLTAGESEWLKSS